MSRANEFANDGEVSVRDRSEVDRPEAGRQGLWADVPGGDSAGPPPHFHPWEEMYVVISGELEVTVDDTAYHLKPGGVAHVPAGVTHGYRNLDDVHFLTIVTRGNAAKFFEEVAADVEMSPPDIAGMIRVAAGHGIEFVL